MGFILISFPFSENSAEIFQLTEKNALERNNPYIFPEHMIEVLLDKDKEITQPILKECNIDINSFHKKIADFLMREPQHRHTIRRITEHHNVPYGEIRDNLIGSNMKPIDLLRCKLSFFGAGRFDPRSDRWVRICMYQNAPFPDELISSYNDFWPYLGLKSF